MKKYLIIALTLCTLSLALYFLVSKNIFKSNTISLETIERCYDNLADVHYYGFDSDDYIPVLRKVNKNEVFADVLANFNVSENKISELMQQSRDVFDVRSFRTGNEYAFLKNRKTGKYDFAVYVKNRADYVVFDLGEKCTVESCSKPTETEQKQVASVITNSLWETMDDNGMSQEIAVKMANIFSSVIDFRKIQKNDKFKIIYDQTTIDGDPYDAGKIYAVEVEHKGETYSAFGFNINNQFEYYDEKGNSLKRMFLKSPLKFSRITSRFNLNRLHPVLGYVRAHKGTDFAAPYGTPILATANGKVVERSYSRGNGNYVKIKHTDNYTTQYLHMSRFSNLKVGSSVKQGDVIGYVGSTGLATGPHVCYRFWKNGIQIDPLRAKLPFGFPLDKKQLAEFLVHKDQYRAMLNNIQYNIQTSGSVAIVDVFISDNS